MSISSLSILKTCLSRTVSGVSIRVAGRMKRAGKTRWSALSSLPTGPDMPGLAMTNLDLKPRKIAIVLGHDFLGFIS